ncbi:MAG: hypothetical protein JWM85_3542, partial [Acidimicrobiaceae bacterium]|nr:hypothetical protein [Acidimicrobiaceae bacterium]
MNAADKLPIEQLERRADLSLRASSSPGGAIQSDPPSVPFPGDAPPAGEMLAFPERTGGRLIPWLRTVAVPCLGVAGLAGVLRIGFPHAYDLFGDEIYYTDISTSVHQGHYPPHYASEGPFLLHPPLFFLMGGLWQDAVRVTGSYFQLVDSMRLFVGLFAIATAVLLFGIGYRLAGWKCGVVAALLFAVDPFALRLNGRVLLETPALAFVLAGYFVLFGIAGHRRSHSARRSHLGIQACCAGILMGLGTVTLELAAVITVGPLLVLYWRKWLVERRLALLAFIGAVIPYAAYLVSLALTNQLGDWFDQDFIGIKRLLGLVHSVGAFNGPKSPSLVHDVIVAAPSYGTTYVLVALGVLSGFYLLFQHEQDRKLLGAVVLFGALTVSYEVVAGANEEQFLYVLLIPAIAAIAVAASSLIGQLSRRETGQVAQRRPVLSA